MATKKKGRLQKAMAKRGAPARAAFKAGGPRGTSGQGDHGARGPRGAARPAQRKLPRKSGPRRKTPRSVGREAAPPVVAPSPTLPDPARALALAVAHAGLDKKAEEVTVFDVRGLSSYADYLVLMTAESDRQAGAIADHVDERMKADGHSKIAVEGYETGTWIIVDYGDVVTHIFGREARAFYDLEGLWADAPRFAVSA
jgi:ribosome-associated protein